MRNFLAVAVALGAAAFASTTVFAGSNTSKTSSRGLIKDCFRYQDFKLEPIGSECIARNDDGIQIGKFKRTWMTLKDGTKVKGIKLLGTEIVMEDAIYSNFLCQTDVYEKDSKGGCIDAIGNSLGAAQYCAARGLRLPTEDEFIQLEQNGFREAFGDDMKFMLLWSSTFQPQFDLAANFIGDTGEIGWGISYMRINGGSARCVGAGSR